MIDITTELFAQLILQHLNVKANGLNLRLKYRADNEFEIHGINENEYLLFSVSDDGYNRNEITVLKNE